MATEWGDTFPHHKKEHANIVQILSLMNMSTGRPQVMEGDESEDCPCRHMGESANFLPPCRSPLMAKAQFHPVGQSFSASRLR